MVSRSYWVTERSSIPVNMLMRYLPSRAEVPAEKEKNASQIAEVLLQDQRDGAAQAGHAVFVRRLYHRRAATRPSTWARTSASIIGPKRCQERVRSPTTTMRSGASPATIIRMPRPR